MYGRLFGGFVLFALLAGCAAMQPIEVREKTYGTDPPVISRSFASKEARRGYLDRLPESARPERGHEADLLHRRPAGDGGVPGQLHPGQGGGTEGACGVYFPEHSGRGDLDFVNLTLTVQVQDMAGHLSAPAVFPLALNARATREAPPQGAFPEKDLGPVMIQLRTPFDDSGSTRTIDRGSRGRFSNRPYGIFLIIGK